MKTLLTTLLTLSLALTASAIDVPRAAVTREPLLGPDGAELPFRSDDEILDFLRTARVLSATQIQKGVNRPSKLLLEKDGVRAHAIFRTVDVRVKTGENLHWKLAPTLRDYFLYECAAYELSRLLGIDLVPPTVERKIGGRRGSLQLWIEQAIDEQARRRDGIDPFDRSEWSRQWESMRIFDVLIHNWDRNLGNILIDSRRRIWLIDHTQSFGNDERLRGLERIARRAPCENSALLERLRGLDHTLLETALSPYLRPRETRALLARLDALVEHLDQLALEEGCP